MRTSDLTLRDAAVLVALGEAQVADVLSVTMVIVTLPTIGTVSGGAPSTGGDLAAFLAAAGLAGLVTVARVRTPTRRS